MQMTTKEIVSSFNRAANKKDQVVILAELNACDKKAICEVLRQEGVDESIIPDFSKKTIVVENQDKKGEKGMARKAAAQTAAAVIENGTVAENTEKKAVPMAVIEVVKAEMEKLRMSIVDMEKKRDELADFIRECGAE